MKTTRLIASLILCLFLITKINAQEITMFQGFWGYQYYQDDVKINDKEVGSLMKSHELTKLYWTKSKKHHKIAIIAFGSQLVTSYLALNSLSNTIGPSDNKDLIFLAASLASAGVAIGYSFSSASLKKKSILGYNNLQQEDGLIYHIGQTNNGVGIVCSF